MTWIPDRSHFQSELEWKLEVIRRAKAREILANRRPLDPELPRKLEQIHRAKARNILRELEERKDFAA